ncbi:MAG TPA: hypothetical protein VHQ90_21955 [Thermoanaerobaculia bacterium]|nr:hypothetical protein [Thermoanaerobaculia bacterium]
MTPHRRILSRPLPRATWIVALALLAGCLGAAAGARAPALPPGMTPLPRGLELRMRELVRAAEEYRGLRLKHPVLWGAVSEAELKKEVVTQFRDDLPPAKLAALEASLKAFGLIPEMMDLETYYPTLLSSQIAGFYDSHRKVLAVVAHRGSLLGKDFDKQYGPAMVRRMEDGLLVHELTHALQDQHFDLNKLEAADPLSDADAARLALVEGDASLTMFDSVTHARAEDLPDNPEHLDMSSALPGQGELAAAPAWLRESLIFSYEEGYAFCSSVRRRGGQRLLDYAFAADPPRSSEQILHPEKWYGSRDDPVVIVWPDLARELPSYRQAAEGQLGEEGIRILLRQALGDPERAAGAAAGWGGDRFAVYIQGGKRVLAWITDWDSPAAAERFHAAAGLAAVKGAAWSVKRPSSRRVTLVRGLAPDAQRAALETQLAAARAEPPANHPIDSALLAGRP